MRRIPSLILLIGIPLMAVSSFAQTPETADAQQLLALLKDVQAQQAQIVANQAKIDSKLAEVSESVHQTRLSSKRGQ